MNNKDKLISVAALMIADAGYLSFTMDQLLEKTGVAKSNAYYHFANKEILGIDVLKYWCDVFGKLIHNTFCNDNISLEKVFLVYFSKLVGFQESSEYCGNPIISITKDLGTKEADEIYLKFVNNFHQSLRRHISQAVKKNKYRVNLNVESTSRLFISLTNASLEESRISKNREPLMLARDQIISFLTYK